MVECLASQFRTHFHPWHRAGHGHIFGSPVNSKAISEFKGTLCENGLATGARLLLFDVTTSAAHDTRRDL